MGKQKILQNESYQSINANSKKLLTPNPDPKNSRKWPKKAQSDQKKRTQNMKDLKKLTK